MDLLVNDPAIAKFYEYLREAGRRTELVNGT